MAMFKYWKKQTDIQIKTRVFGALDQNVNYDQQLVLGVPASYLDDQVFYQDATFLKDAPFISTLIQNPNHIGCHTLGESEHFFKGTQDIERELLNICAVDILKGESDQFDGYVAAGGTEANLQAIWIYRNYFIEKDGAHPSDIAIICSEDSHYSMDKAANIMMLDVFRIPVDSDTRMLQEETVSASVDKLIANGKKYFIVICNMMTTMFGSVDKSEVYVKPLSSKGVKFKIHVDGAYGGFYYPFTSAARELTFENPHISSFTLDAHKMAQAPYGTGLFLIRKDYMQFTNTKEASYVEGQDFTMIGSRSGANAVAVWMILVKKGPYGWKEKTIILQERTKWMSNQLAKRDIRFYRHLYSNIVTIKASAISAGIAQKFGLVPDNHRNPEWYKIVIMDHVTIEKLQLLLSDLDMVS